MGFQKWKGFLKYVCAGTHTPSVSFSNRYELSVSSAIMKTALSGAFE